MPVILREKGYEFFFVMFDLDEPIHVHVRHERKQAKYWIDPISLAWTRGFRPHELNEIERIIGDNHAYIRRVWQRERAKRQ
ncbi:MAG: DUF4160 domain-containing protein [Chloroflexi bacterium]|nr:DUF4160 domain-containing protein [Chloroflexota bacterium]